ncbi:hypothetical protein ACQCVP_07670 [Rossellomorea vietnamensis]
MEVQDMRIMLFSAEKAGCYATFSSISSYTWIDFSLFLASRASASLPK